MELIAVLLAIPFKKSVPCSLFHWDSPFIPWKAKTIPPPSNPAARFHLLVPATSVWVLNPIFFAGLKCARKGCRMEGATVNPAGVDLHQLGTGI